MIRFVLMDLDDTILDFHRAEAAAVSKTLLRLGIEPTQQIVQRYSEINAAHWRMLERGEITRPQVLTGRFRQLFSEIGADCDPEQAQQIYEAYLSQGHYFISGAEQLLAELYGKYLLYLVSNGNAVVQKGRLKSAGIAPFFEEIFISEQIGADKPSKVYFDRCFAKIPNFDQDHAILIGDSPTSDILGGINAGVKTCWFNPNHRPPHPLIRADYEIDRLSAFPALLKSI